MRIPLFRPTTADFRIWCKQYVGLSFSIVKAYEKDPLSMDTEEYKAAKKICRQYKVLLASLDKKQRKIFENTIMSKKAIHYSDKEERIAFSVIFGNWKEICFPENKFQLKTIDKKQLGERITALRKMNGYTREQVASFVGINAASLKAYENGERMMRFDVAYKLAQVYEISIGKMAD